MSSMEKAVRRASRIGSFRLWRDKRHLYSPEYTQLFEYVLMIGDGGFSSIELSNTEESYIASAEEGFGGASADVRITVDGALLLSNSVDVSLSNGKRLPISTSTQNELLEAPLMHSSQGSHLCTFERYLEIMKANQMQCFIHLNGFFGDSKIQELVNIIESTYDIIECEIQSFSIDNLIRSHEQFPDLKGMLLCPSADKNYQKCFEYGFDLLMHYSAITPKIIQEFHKRNLRVGVYGVESIQCLHYCYHMDVDFIESSRYSHDPLLDYDN